MTFKNGDRVKVSNKSLKTYGRTGTVIRESVWDGTYCINMDFNGTMLFYKSCNLILMNKEEICPMAITGDFQVAKIKFLSGTNTNTEYEYAMFEDYQIGDTVVVASAHHGLGVAKITDIISQEEAATKKFEREIICAVYMDAYEKRKKNRAKLAELTNRMNQRVQELNKLAIFEMMAERDESLKSMLEEYKNLIR